MINLIKLVTCLLFYLMLKFIIQSKKTSKCEAHDVQLLHQYICGCDNADVVSGGLRQSDNAHRLLTHM